MQQLLLTMLALFAAMGMASGGSGGSSGTSLGGKKSGTDDFGSDNGNNNDSDNDFSFRDTDITPPSPPVQDVDPSDGGGTAPVDASSGSYSVAGGRVTTLQVSDAENVASVRVIDGPAHGNLTVNPDNTLALVMSHEHTFSGQISYSYEVSYTDGRTEVFNDTASVAPSAQQAGWGAGEYYMLETDADGNVIVEAGENHREVYISGSGDALSRADIAAMEGLSTGQITNSWLRAHPEYGGSEGMALDVDAGMGLWYEITGDGNAPSSDWLLFEAGYSYDTQGRLVDASTQGEDPLHPVHITSYGSGPQPVLNGTFYLSSGSNENIVISDLAVVGSVQSLTTSNLIFDNVNVTGGGGFNQGVGIMVAGGDGITLNNSSIVDVFYASNPSGGDWTGGDGTAGFLAGNTTGLLVQGSFFDHNGWADDYNPDMSGDGGQPPSTFSHNVYIDYDNIDVTFRDNITMRAAMMGAHLRGGAFAEDNLFLDSNAAVDFFGGDFYGAGSIGTYTLFTDNVITSAGHRVTESPSNGALAMGIQNDGLQSTLLDNIVAHLADPNNPDEIAEKIGTNNPVHNVDSAYYDDTIVYSWQGSGPWDPEPSAADRNIDGLSTATLDVTTIQRFTQQLLGDPNAGIDDLANVLRAQAAGQLDDVVDADLIIAFFQAGFGVGVEGRLEATTLRFVPDDLGDGIRWDNRLNWSTDDLPGTPGDGDSVDLAGNWVNYGGTTTIQDLDFGEGGTLNVSHGRLDVADHTAVGEMGGTLNISSAGQVWMDGYTDRDELDLNITGGRFVNTGIFNGLADIDIHDGQVVLANAGADMILRNGTRLEIHGDDATVGFGDDSGTAPGVMLMDTGADLVFTAEGGQIGTIGEIQTGRFDGNVQSGINLGGGELELNIAGLSNGTHTLINVNEIIGEFGEVDVNGLGSRNATITVDYDTDRVQLALSSGSGNVTVNTIGDASNAQANTDLWDALTNGHGIYPDDPPSTIVGEEDDIDEAA